MRSKLEISRSDTCFAPDTSIVSMVIISFVCRCSTRMRTRLLLRSGASCMPMRFPFTHVGSRHRYDVLSTRGVSAAQRASIAGAAQRDELEIAALGVSEHHRVIDGLPGFHDDLQRAIEAGSGLGHGAFERFGIYL
jgi:hypothetical protein